MTSTNVLSSKTRLKSTNLLTETIFLTLICFSASKISTSLDIKLSRSHEKPPSIVKSTVSLLTLSPIKAIDFSLTQNKYICFGAIFSRKVTFSKTPSHTRSLNTSSSASATSGFFSLRSFHSDTVMDCVAKKLINSL